MNYRKLLSGAVVALCAFALVTTPVKAQPLLKTNFFTEPLGHSVSVPMRNGEKINFLKEVLCAKLYA